MATYESKKYGTIPVAATQIADGSVTNAEYQFINSLSSNAQTQITALDTAKLNLTGGTLTGNVTLADNVHAYFGAGQDIDILSDGTVGYIKANDLRLQSSTGENYVTAAVNGATKLFYDNSQKLETTSAGATISGTLTATTFSGSGASLTSLPAGNLTGTVADARISTLTASKLTGALPAIDGSNLTGIDVVPSGTDTVGAIRTFALYASSGGSPNNTTISVGTEITPATYTNGGNPALYLAIDPGALRNSGYNNSISHAITGKTRTTVSGTWRVLTIGEYQIDTVSSGPNAGNQSSYSNGFLAQRIT